VCTFLIFLISAIACVVTFSLYIINPLDHNVKLLKLKESSIKTKANIQIGNNTLTFFNTTTLSIKVKEVNNELVEIQLNSTILRKNYAENDTDEHNSHNLKVRKDKETTSTDNDNIENKNSNSTYKKVISWKVIKPKGSSRLRNSKAKQLIETSLPVRAALTLSYLIDITRAMPQLYIVNRFVKTQRLHVIYHSHSHASLAALFIKPLVV